MWQGDDGRSVADRYALEAVLHGRGLGVIWRARDLDTGRPVALKQLRPPGWLPADELPTLAATIRREVAVAAGVHHPALAYLYDMVLQHGEPFLVMELVDGVTLHELVGRHGLLPPRRVAQLGIDVLGGLAALHQVGVLHGAVSPGCLLVTAAGAARLVGVGTGAVRLDQRALRGGATTSSRVLAPELRAGGPAGPGVDVWAVGATLHYAATGSPPAGATGTGRAWVASEVADWLAQVLARLLAAEPAERPTAADAARMLLAATPDHALPQQAAGPAVVLSPPAEQPALAGIPAPATPPVGAGLAPPSGMVAQPGIAGWNAGTTSETGTDGRAAGAGVLDTAPAGPATPPWTGGADQATLLLGPGERPEAWASQTGLHGTPARGGPDGPEVYAGDRPGTRATRAAMHRRARVPRVAELLEDEDRPRTALAVALVAIFLAALAVLVVVAGVRVLAGLVAPEPQVAPPPATAPPPPTRARAAVTTTPPSTATTTTVPLLRIDRQAESGILGGGARTMRCDRCSGDDRVGFIGHGGTLTFTGLKAPRLGPYSLSIYYATDERRDAFLSINGGQGQPLSFRDTGGFDRVRRVTIPITLRAGENTLTFFNPAGFAPDIDRIRIRPV